jgi:uncharacterized protein (DUF427 family)
MATVLEDRVVGSIASPLFKDGYRWENANRRVRNVLNGVTVADSAKVWLLHEAGRLPIFYFPVEDVRQDLLVASDHHTESPLKGTASYWHIQVEDRVAQNAVWRYLNPPPQSPPVKDYVAFYWHKLDHWYEEDEEVFGHARDPHKRIDVLPSSRHVRVVLGGETVADTRRARLLLETGIVTRFYIPFEDVRKDLLLPTDTHTRCPYKGQASYWSVQIGDRVYKDVVWSYPNPLPESLHIAGMLSFYNERVDAIYLDDELFPKPQHDFFKRPEEDTAAGKVTSTN